MKTAKEQVKDTGRYRPETEKSGKSLRGRPGSTQRSETNDDDENDDDDDDDDMWRRVRT